MLSMQYSYQIELNAYFFIFLAFFEVNAFGKSMRLLWCCFLVCLLLCCCCCCCLNWEQTRPSLSCVPPDVLLTS